VSAETRAERPGVAVGPGGLRAPAVAVALVACLGGLGGEAGLAPSAAGAANDGEG